MFRTCGVQHENTLFINERFWTIFPMYATHWKLTRDFRPWKIFIQGKWNGKEMSTMIEHLKIFWKLNLKHEIGLSGTHNGIQPSSEYDHHCIFHILIIIKGILTVLNLCSCHFSALTFSSPCLSSQLHSCTVTYQIPTNVSPQQLLCRHTVPHPYHHQFVHLFV